MRLPGARDVRATLDGGDGEHVVVACPPHPQMGGDRRDGRLRAVSDALADRDIDCLRFDYGPWDDGQAEQTDAANALGWAHERYDDVGLFGYSFGGSVALLAGGDAESGLAALSVLAPGAGALGDDVVVAVDTIECPLQVLYGERDDVVDWEPVVDSAHEHGHTVEAIEGDHFFVGQQTKVAEHAGAFLADHLRRTYR